MQTRPHIPSVSARGLAARTACVLAAAALLAALALPAPAPADAQVEQDPDPATPVVDRLTGTGRVETALAISADAFDAAGGVVITRADRYADALAGAPLAAKSDWPLLLTDGAALSDGILAEIGRLGAGSAVLLGGEQALAPAVEDELVAAGVATNRIAGTTRFHTAAAIAARVVDGQSEPTVYVAEGADADPARGWPDALSGAWYAAQIGAPILLVETDDATGPTTDALAALAPAEVVVVGGAVAVSDATLAALEAASGASVRRLAGTSRYETSGAVYDEALSRGADPAVRWVATGRNFPDALAAGAAVAANGDALLLIDGQDLGGSPRAGARLDAAYETLRRVVLLGGTDAISAAAEDQITALLAPQDTDSDFCLTILHNNDGESRLLDAGSGVEDFGGIARFATVLQAEQARGAQGRAGDGCDSHGVLTVSAGDSFLAGPFFSASLDKGVPFYDSIALDYLGYDAYGLGNHEFDFGPQVTADFINGFEGDTPFLAANLSFAQEPALQALVDDGRILPRALLPAGDRTIGVIGLTTDELTASSSPRNVAVEDVEPAVLQREVDAARSDGADIVVVVSHLQGLATDVALVEQTSGVDIVVGGGGDEVLGDPGDLYVPEDHTRVQDTYPFAVTGADGQDVEVVTTPGDYKYVGRLVARFDDGNDLVGVDARHSRLIRVAGGDLPDAVAPDAFLVDNVEAPVTDYVANLAANVIGTSEVPLDGVNPTVRLQETNLGNLLADALLWQGQELAPEFGLAVPDVALQNGGGIRNNTVIPPGDITELDTFAVAAFSNFVAVLEDVPAAELKLVLEETFAEFPVPSGSFPQIAGMTVVADSSRRALERDADDAITFTGDRVVSVVLDDGTVLVADGQVPADAPGVGVATIDFLARGGSNTPFSSAEFATVGVTYQQALRDYIAVDLVGLITAAQYPEEGSGRITVR